MLKKLTDKDFWIHSLLALCIVGLLAGYLFLLRDVSKIKEVKPALTSVQNTYSTTDCGTDCQRQIEEELSARLAKITPAPEVVVTPAPTTSSGTTTQNQTQASKKTTYIPFSGGYQTTSTDWVEVTGAQAYIDLKNNYSVNAYVTFEAVLKAPGGGVSYARLFDSTHGIAVDGSEVSTSLSSSTLVSSGKLNLWSGNNLYVVQVKSLNSSNVNFDSGRIKLVY